MDLFQGGRGSVHLPPGTGRFVVIVFCSIYPSALLSLNFFQVHTSEGKVKGVSKCLVSYVVHTQYKSKQKFDHYHFNHKLPFCTPPPPPPQNSEGVYLVTKFLILDGKQSQGILCLVCNEHVNYTKLMLSQSNQQ